MREEGHTGRRNHAPETPGRELRQAQDKRGVAKAVVDRADEFRAPAQRDHGATRHGRHEATDRLALNQRPGDEEDQLVE